MFRQDIFQWLTKYNLTIKQARLIVACVILLLIKFIIMPIIDWQNEIKEQTDFYKIQLRDPAIVEKLSQKLSIEKVRLNKELGSIKSQYLVDTPTEKLQVQFIEKLETKVNSLNLELTSRSAQVLLSDGNITTIEYVIEVKGYVKPLADLIFWLETQEPQVLIHHVDARSVRSSAMTKLRLRGQQFMIVGAK